MTGWGTTEYKCAASRAEGWAAAEDRFLISFQTETEAQKQRHKVKRPKARRGTSPVATHYDQVWIVHIVHKLEHNEVIGK